MKKIVIMSDNHGDMNILTDIKVLEDDADYYIHCGDSESYQLRDLDEFVAVKGNNDWRLSGIPVFQVSRYASRGLYEGKKVEAMIDFMPELSTEKMLDFLKKYNGDVLISGHTHMPLVKEKNGLWLINPGSTSWPRGGSKRSYAVMTIDGTNVDVRIKTLE